MVRKLAKQRAKAGRRTAKAERDKCLTDTVGQPVLRLASDCSGWCPEIQAAERDLPTYKIEHLFACDSAISVQKLIGHFFHPEEFFKNVECRPQPSRKKPIDIYVSGWPCQAFSRAGLKKGLGDARGTLIIENLECIKHCEPTSFIIENVPNLVTKFTEVFDMILVELGFSGMYWVTWDLRDTRLHGGLPQNRTRVYIVGIKKKSMRAAFTWPAVEHRAYSLDQVLSKRRGNVAAYHALNKTFKRSVDAANAILLKKGINPLDVDAIYDIGGTKPSWAFDACPTITASRGGQRAFWSSHRFRLLTVDELMLLQGAHIDSLRGWRDAIGEASMGRIVGNAMTAAVVANIMKSILVSIGHRL